MTSQTPAPASSRAAQAEVAAALQTSRELGPEYDDAVAAAVSDKLDTAIEARVHEHVDALRQPSGRVSPEEQWKSPRLIMGMIAMVAAIPLTAISGGIMGTGGVFLSWSGLILVYLISVVGLGRR